MSAPVWLGSLDVLVPTCLAALTGHYCNRPLEFRLHMFSLIFLATL